MRLTSFTDYTLRSLIYLGMHRDRLVTIQDIADLHDISKNHLTKVIHQLGVTGLVETVRGRNGGLRLGKEPEEINIGAVVRQSESDFFMAECFDTENNSCVLDGNCYLKVKLKEATEAYLQVLDGLTLAKLLPRQREGQGADVQPVQFLPRLPV
ncbi:Rrf2 family transcriptional regulator [Duganella sp. FT92W]|uniref:Rrf2 family transcriptional regulator n=1 Tax=Pseudoduganella rivuli TaxID=2666085 RepID=A0A7X2II32_9BURK|nr:Rrf2 family transcriptional regulator [Pseudoduganella rivuli]MRV70196.1 Rrf2 family transcriptional regulator [Pseudoduganella rivuli]